MDEALAIAREGIENNPTSGLLLANYAQLLLMQDKKANLPEMLKLARAGHAARTLVGRTSDDKFEGYGIFRTVYRSGGQPADGRRDRQRSRTRSKQQGAGSVPRRDGLPSGEGEARRAQPRLLLPQRARHRPASAARPRASTRCSSTWTTRCFRATRVDPGRGQGVGRRARRQRASGLPRLEQLARARGRRSPRSSGSSSSPRRSSRCRSRSWSRSSGWAPRVAQAAIVGDQMFTDVLGGKLPGSRPYSSLRCRLPICLIRSSCAGSSACCWQVAPRCRRAHAGHRDLGGTRAHGSHHRHDAARRRHRLAARALAVAGHAQRRLRGARPGLGLHPAARADEIGLRRVVAAIRALPFVGFNVTMPYKAARARAVRRGRDGGEHGRRGEHRALRRRPAHRLQHRRPRAARVARDDAGFAPEGKRVVLLGAGGAAGAAIVALILGRAASVDVVNRDLERAEELVAARRAAPQGDRGRRTHASTTPSRPSATRTSSSTRRRSG